jgi:quercetin dioxygenase-like cupin family protein
MGYILDGTAILTVDGADYPVKNGDSINFLSQLPHRLYNNGTGRFRAVWSISPPHVDYLDLTKENNENGKHHNGGDNG